MENKFKDLEGENKALRSCSESVSAFEKEMHDDSLRVAKETVHRDSKAVANIILNMRFGNRRNVSFCEIFSLKDCGGCQKHECCTDCIHEFLEKHFTVRKQDGNTKDMIRQLHEAGGCDATDDYCRGWDAAITEAIQIVENVLGIRIENILG